MRAKILCIGVLLALAACKPQGAVQSVEWYKEHKAERRAMLAECKAQGASGSADCANAQQAETEVKSARRGYVDTTPVDFSKEK